MTVKSAKSAEVTKPKRGPYKIPSIYPLSGELQLRQKIRVADAARLVSLCEDTFRKEYPELIRNVTDRIQVVELGDALAIGQAVEQSKD
jgi:hypothetical protein